MRAFSKRLFAMVLAMALSLGSVMVVSAATPTTNSSVKLIERKDYVYGKTSASYNGSTYMNLTIKRGDDDFNVYQLAYTDWTKTTVNGKAVYNAEVKWFPVVDRWLANWLASADATTKAIYATPKALGENEYTISYVTEKKEIDGKLKDVLVEKRELKPDGEMPVINMLNAMRADSDFMAALDAAGLIVASKDGELKTSAGEITPIDGDSSVYVNDVESSDPGATKELRIKRGAVEDIFDSIYVWAKFIDKTVVVVEDDRPSLQTVKIIDDEAELFYSTDPESEDVPADYSRVYKVPGTEISGTIYDFETVDAYNDFVTANEGDDLEEKLLTKIYTESVNLNTGTDRELNYLKDETSYRISPLSYGLFFVDAKSGTREYQPVLVDIMPGQVGPNGNWYITNANLSKTLKFEDIQVVKWIDTKASAETIKSTTYYDTTVDHSSVVNIGDLAHFTIKSQIPKYSNVASPTFTGFDEMAQGFGLIATSATIYLYDSAGRMCHPYIAAANNNHGLISLKGATLQVGGTELYTAYFIEEANVYYEEGDPEERPVLFGVNADAGNVDFYAPVDGLITYITSKADTPAGYKATYTALKSIAGVDMTGKNLVKADYTKSIISIEFKYNNLMNPDTYDGIPSTNLEEGFTYPDYFIVNYDADVKENMNVGNRESDDRYAEKNTNNVKIHYQKDSAGTIGYAEDEVRAYTYGVDIVKIDGKLTEADKGYYLSGAEFSIFKKDVTYCGGSEYSTQDNAPSKADYANFSFLSDESGHQGAGAYAAAKSDWTSDKSLAHEAITNTFREDAILSSSLSILTLGAETVNAAAKFGDFVADQSTEDFDTADKYSKKFETLSSNAYKAYLYRYILPKVGDGKIDYQAIPVWVSDCSECHVPHYHIDYYVTVWTGIESADVAELYNSAVGDDYSEAIAVGSAGVQKNGLGAGTYLLKETQSPYGYNDMGKALQFSMTEYTDSQAEMADTRKGFIGDDDRDYTDGIYPITVENYKGMTLPSTGGMGTLLFTLIGILTMGGVIVVILVRRNKEQEIF